MHAFGRADDGVDGARIDAQRAADARVSSMRATVSGPGSPQTPVERDGRLSGQRRQLRDQVVSAGRAAIDRYAGRDGLGVRPAAS